VYCFATSWIRLYKRVPRLWQGAARIDRDLSSGTRRLIQCSLYRSLFVSLRVFRRVCPCRPEHVSHSVSMSQSQLYTLGRASSFRTCPSTSTRRLYIGLVIVRCNSCPPVPLPLLRGLCKDWSRSSFLCYRHSTHVYMHMHQVDKLVSSNRYVRKKKESDSK
jgi:hypothetical protein